MFQGRDLKVKTLQWEPDAAVDRQSEDLHTSAQSYPSFSPTYLAETLSCPHCACDLLQSRARHRSAASTGNISIPVAGYQNTTLLPCLILISFSLLLRTL